LYCIFLMHLTAAITIAAAPVTAATAAAAYEILELYLELVSVRATMIAQSKTIPGDMMEVRHSTPDWEGGGRKGGRGVCVVVVWEWVGGGAGGRAGGRLSSLRSRPFQGT
jgi:hypothetical protein